MKIGEYLEKKIIKESEYQEDELPQIDELIKIKYKLYEKEYELEFKIGKEDKFEILEQLVQTMFLDEISIFKINKDIFINNENKDNDILYSKENIEIQIELIDYWKDEENPLDFALDERLTKCLEYKNKGKKNFEENDLDESLINFNKALEFIDWINGKENQNEKINLCNNISLIYLKKEEYLESINYCNYCLKFDENNIKALFKKGKCLFLSNKYEESLDVLKKLIQIDESNIAAQNIINKIQNLLKKEKKDNINNLKKVFN